MSPVRHAVSGPAISFTLEEEMQHVRGQLATASARIARTLVKMGPLRVTLVGIRAGGSLHEHTSQGPVTIHVLEGAIEVVTRENTWPLPTGTLLSLDAGVPHAVESAHGSLFLLTVANPAQDEPQVR